MYLNPIADILRQKAFDFYHLHSIHNVIQRHIFLSHIKQGFAKGDKNF